MKKVVHFGLIGLLAASSLSLTACSDEEVAFGAGVVIGAVVASDHRPVRRYYPPHPRHRPPVRRRYFEAQADLSNGAKAALHFGVSVDAGEKIMQALEAAQQKDFSHINQLGMERTDLEAMARGENPSASTLVSLSRNLGIEFDQAHGVVQTMKRDLVEGMNR